jgi:hypothetical protein
VKELVRELLRLRNRHEAQLYLLSGHYVGSALIDMKEAVISVLPKSKREAFDCSYTEAIDWTDRYYNGKTEKENQDYKEELAEILRRFGIEPSDEI